MAGETSSQPPRKAATSQHWAEEDLRTAVASIDGAYRGHWQTYAQSSPGFNGRIWSEGRATWKDGTVHDDLPDYTKSRDDILAVILAQSEEVIQKVVEHVCATSPDDAAMTMLKASAWQLCVALVDVKSGSTK